MHIGYILYHANFEKVLIKFCQDLINRLKKTNNIFEVGNCSHDYCALNFTLLGGIHKIALSSKIWLLRRIKKIEPVRLNFKIWSTVLKGGFFNNIQLSC